MARAESSNQAWLVRLSADQDQAMFQKLINGNTIQGERRWNWWYRTRHCLWRVEILWLGFKPVCGYCKGIRRLSRTLRTPTFPCKPSKLSSQQLPGNTLLIPQAKFLRSRRSPSLVTQTREQSLTWQLTHYDICCIPKTSLIKAWWLFS